MSWRTATPTTGFTCTVDFTPGRKSEPIPVQDAKAKVDAGSVEQSAWGGHPVAKAFHAATAGLLESIAAAFPGCKVEIETSGHVDDVNGGYGSIALRIHPATA